MCVCAEHLCAEHLCAEHLWSREHEGWGWHHALPQPGCAGTGRRQTAFFTVCITNTLLFLTILLQTDTHLTHVFFFFICRNWQWSSGVSVWGSGFHLQGPFPHSASVSRSENWNLLFRHSLTTIFHVFLFSHLGPDLKGATHLNIITWVLSVFTLQNKQFRQG